MTNNIETLTSILMIVIVVIVILLAILAIVYFNSKNKKEKKSKNSVIEKSNVKEQKSKSFSVESVMDFMEFDTVEDNMIVQKNGNKYIMVIECQGINYDLMSAVEKNSVE